MKKIELKPTGERIMLLPFEDDSAFDPTAMVKVAVKKQDKKKFKGVIVDISPTIIAGHGFEIGMVVLYPEYSGDKVPWHGKEYIFLHPSNILCIVEGEKYVEPKKNDPHK